MLLTPHFHLDELVASETAARHGIDNTPPPAALDNLRLLAEALEEVRRALNLPGVMPVPITITSGYRCPEVEVLVGGTMSKGAIERVQDSTRIAAVRAACVQRLTAGRFSQWESSHGLGLAADFIAPRAGRPLVVAQRIAGMPLAWDQVIHEFGRWVHFAVGPGVRRQLLTIDGQGTRLGLLEARA